MLADLISFLTLQDVVQMEKILFNPKIILAKVPIKSRIMKSLIPGFIYSVFIISQQVHYSI
jgi:hypothetical protein